MFFTGNPVEIAPGMVFFLHMILMDSEAGLAMTLGRTSLITARGAEPLSKAALDLVVAEPALPYLALIFLLVLLAGLLATCFF